MKRTYRQTCRLAIAGLVLASIAMGWGCDGDGNPFDDLKNLDIHLVNNGGAEGLSAQVTLESSVSSEYFSQEVTLNPEKVGTRDGFDYHALLTLDESVVEKVAAGDKMRITATLRSTKGSEKVCTLEEAASEGDVWAIITGTEVRCYFHTVECDDPTC